MHSYHDYPYSLRFPLAPKQMYAFAASIDERKCWCIICLDPAWWREILGGDYLTYWRNSFESVVLAMCSDIGRGIARCACTPDHSRSLLFGGIGACRLEILFCMLKRLIQSSSMEGITDLLLHFKEIHEWHRANHQQERITRIFDGLFLMAV